jgi:aspartyl protease family protein
MLKAVLSLAVPIIAFAAYFGGSAATISSKATAERPAVPAARAASAATPAPDSRACRRGEELIVAADAQGHFQVSVEIGRGFTPMMVDTGATRVILPHEEAVRLGLPLENVGSAQVSTANGTVLAKVTRADRFRVGPICLTNVDVLVMPPGRLAVGLLGMSVIGNLARFEMSRTRLVMAY